jgi:hypothetical protein
MPGSWPQHEFPNLNDQNCVVASPLTRKYNCIAWAASNATRKWWPDALGIGYWPPNVARQETIDAFVRAYETLGYLACNDDSLEVGFEKIALYVDTSGTPTHAALQLPDGRWTSKIGDFEDIEHETVNDLNGPCYGRPVRYLRRPRQP